MKINWNHWKIIETSMTTSRIASGQAVLPDSVPLSSGRGRREAVSKVPGGVANLEADAPAGGGRRISVGKPPGGGRKSNQHRYRNWILFEIACTVKCQNYWKILKIDKTNKWKSAKISKITENCRQYMEIW